MPSPYPDPKFPRFFRVFATGKTWLPFPPFPCFCNGGFSMPSPGPRFFLLHEQRGLSSAAPCSAIIAVGRQAGQAVTNTGPDRRAGVVRDGIAVVHALNPLQRLLVILQLPFQPANSVEEFATLIGPESLPGQPRFILQ